MTVPLMCELRRFADCPHWDEGDEHCDHGPCPVGYVPLLLNSDRHETMMTERAGLFSVYCGCGWKAQDLTVEAAEDAEADHLRADNHR